MTTFLTFGSLWFWFIFLIAFICLIISTEKESGWGASATMLITLALFFLFGNKIPLSGFFSYCIHHGWIFIGSVSGYIITGVCWSILKWYSFLLKERDRIKSDVKNDSNTRYIYAPKVRDHKSGIMVWMFYWPFSMLWTLIDVPVKRIYQLIYRVIASKLQEMSDKVFADLTKKTREREEQANLRREDRGLRRE